MIPDTRQPWKAECVLLVQEGAWTCVQLFVLGHSLTNSTVSSGRQYCETLKPSQVCWLIFLNLWKLGISSQYGCMERANPMQWLSRQELPTGTSSSPVLTQTWCPGCSFASAPQACTFPQTRCIEQLLCDGVELSKGKRAPGQVLGFTELTGLVGETRL